MTIDPDDYSARIAAFGQKLRGIMGLGRRARTGPLEGLWSGGRLYAIITFPEADRRIFCQVTEAGMVHDLTATGSRQDIEAWQAILWSFQIRGAIVGSELLATFPPVPPDALSLRQFMLQLEPVLGEDWMLSLGFRPHRLEMGRLGASLALSWSPTFLGYLEI